MRIKQAAKGVISLGEEFSGRRVSVMEEPSLQPLATIRTVRGAGLAGLLLSAAVAQGAEEVRVHDDRLRIELFAEHPQIVTPTGLDVDARGRVLAIENNTHMRPEDYNGHPSDRVLLLEDGNGDGRADRVTTWHDGLVNAMDLAIHPSGAVYLATRDTVLRLEDRDGDDVAEVVEVLAALDTTADYPHNGLEGIAFDFSGNLYFGLGTNRGEPYTLTAADGTALEGGHGIGTIFQIRSDGTGLRRVAAGFWNPFNLCVDVFGRVFATENDPGDRPPSRLIHVVEGGDYGYERRYKSGRHPFVAWDGELPGTLPMAAGIGEAPCQILACESDGLPADFQGDFLIASWSDHRIERYRLKPRGASFEAEREILVSGPLDFRPVDMAFAPDGSIYITDWVDGSYPVHGKGRIWRLSWKDAPIRERPEDPVNGLHVRDRSTRESAARELAGSERGRDHLLQAVEESADVRVRAAAFQGLGAADDAGLDAAAADILQEDAAAGLKRLAAVRLLEGGADPAELAGPNHDAEVRFEAIRRLRLPRHRELLFDALGDSDPFLRHAAIDALARFPAVLAREDWAAVEDATRRAGLLVALRRSGAEDAGGWLESALQDPARDVRLIALKWVGDERMEAFRPVVEAGLETPGLTVELFRAHLAALQRLDTDDPRGQTIGVNLLLGKIQSADTPAQVTRLSLRLLPPDAKGLEEDDLERLLAHADAGVRLEAVRTLQMRPVAETAALLARVAAHEAEEKLIRAEAIVGLAPAAADHLELLVRLAAMGEPQLSGDALRSLIGVTLSDAQAQRLRETAERYPVLKSEVLRVLGEWRPDRPAPEATGDWMEQIGPGGNAEEGRRIFFHSKVAACAQCHQVEGRGVSFGPDLSEIHRQLDREPLLESILQPDQEVAPEYLPWIIRMDDGRQHYGLGLRKGGAREVYLGIDGKEFSVPTDSIAMRRELQNSPMPPGLAAGMTRSELRDLLAFLLEKEPPGGGGQTED